MKSLDDYLPIVGEKVVGQIYQKAHRLINKHIVHINSTAYGRGVAEILNNLIVLLNDVDVISRKIPAVRPKIEYHWEERSHQASISGGRSINRRENFLTIQSSQGE